MRLLTIPVSHYCEKARWALDRAGVPYVEEQHLQLLHRRPVRKAGGGTTVPVLVTPERTLADSHDILLFADSVAAEARRLYPADPAQRAEALELESWLDREYGVETRRLAYFHFLAQGRLFLRYNGVSAPRWEKLVLRAAFPLAKGMLRRRLNVTEEAVVGARAVIARTLDEVAELLADGRAYLVGERFSAADLTFAALTAPILLPAGYGVALPPLDALSPELRALVTEYRAHPAGAFALRMYADERYSVPATS